MAITAIKRTYNGWNGAVVVHNRENGRRYEIPGGVGRGMDEWVPWCWNEGRFNNNHYIEVRISSPGQEDTVYAVYQNDNEGRDYVRFSTRKEVPGFDDPGIPLQEGEGEGGAATAGGDRVLQIMADGSLRIGYAGGPIPELRESFTAG